MTYHVNDGCIGCGLCAGACPEVFTMNDSGLAEAAPGEVDASLEEAAQQAMDGCPVQAIEQG